MKKVLLAILFAFSLGLVPAHFAQATLTTSLISYWNLNEASGTRDDAASTNDLTDNNTVTSATGKVNDTAQFTALNSESLSIADNTALSTGDIDFSIAGWVYLDDLLAIRDIFGKWNTNGVNQREYIVLYNSGTNRFNFIVSSNGTATTTLAATSSGALSASTWYYVVAWHDSVNNTLNIQVNNGTVDSSSYSSGVFDSTASFIMGARTAAAVTSYHNGRIDSVGFWKKVLTSDERTELYNSGNGLGYPFLPGVPTALSSTAGNAQVALSWTAPSDTGGASITDYLIEYKLSSSGVWGTFADGVSAATTATVTGLTDDSFYDFRISAINAAGTGSASSTSTAIPSSVALKQNLFAFYPLDETSGTRSDDLGQSDLTESAATGFATGKVDNAASFTGTTYLSTPENAYVSAGNIDFTVAGWVYLTSKTATQGLVTKWETNSTREYALIYNQTLDRFQFSVSSTGSDNNPIQADTLGSPSVNTWYYVVAWHDSVNNTLNIQVDNGTADSVSYSSGVIDSTSVFSVGSLNLLNLATARVDAVGFWKRALTSGERTDLYNSGFGIEYPFTAGDAIAIGSPYSYQVIQRDGLDQADILISGTYAGSPTAIEASWNGGAYATIDASPSGGTFSGTLTNQSAGQGTLTVRFTNNTSVTASVSYVGVGDVYVTAGQSNASGHGDNNQSYSHATLKAGLFGNDDVWKELVDPSDSDVGQIDAVSADATATGSVWPLLATHIMDNENVPVAFVPVSKGGSAILEWQRNNANPGDTTTLYGSMYRRINAIGNIKAVLFYQGETDSLNAVSQSTYLSYLEALTADIMSDFAVKTVIAQIGHDTRVNANDNPIRLAQIEAWDTDPNAFPGPATYDISTSDESGDGIHLNSDADLQTLANRWWSALDAAYYGGADDGRGPILASAGYSVDRDTIVLTFTDDTLPLTASGALTTTVFIVEDNSTPVTISDADIVGTNTVVLTLAAPTSTTTITVSLGSDQTGAGATVPTDNTTYNLPAEIFIDEVVSADTAPTLAEVTPVSTPTTDTTPDYTFSSTEAGTITYGGDCSSATTSASSGNNTITFSTLADGTYTNCTITVTDVANNDSNTLIVTSFTVDTSPETVPDAPTALAASGGDTDVELTWTAPADDGGSAITDYLVEYKLSSSGTWGTFADGTSTSTTATVTGLTNDLAYDFRVSATNAIGTSSPSPTDTATPTSSSPAPTPSSPSAGSGYTSNSADIPGHVPSAAPCSLGDRFNTTTGTPCSTATPTIPTSSSTSFFTRDLKIGDIGMDVKVLQQFLNTHGFILAATGPGSPGNETTLFGALTRTALIRFQEAYAAQILTPLGLSKGTGYFGTSTRAFISTFSTTTQ